MKKIILFFSVLIGLHLFLLIILQFTAWPEMVSFPYLINHGFATYKDMVHAYPPLLVNILAVLYKLFGYNIFILKILGWTSFVIDDILVFLILRKLIKNEKLILVGVFIYVILQPILEGNMVWPDLFMIPFLLGGFLLILQKKYYWSGFVFALALLTKQTAVLYIVFSILYIVFIEKNFRKLSTFLVGEIVVVAPFFVSLITQNSLRDFINWTIFYPSKYWTNFPGYVQLSPTLRENLVLLILFLPLVYLIFKSSKQIFSDKYFLILFAFLIAGIIGVYPRFSFFHLQPGLAFFVLLVIYLNDKIKFNIYILLLIPFFVLILNLKSLNIGSNRFWGESDLLLAKIIQNETQENEPIYLLGLNSNIYAFAERLPNKSWLDNFGWYLEIPSIQEQVILGFKKNPPSRIFWQTPEVGNWYDIGTYQSKMITDWIKKNYMIKKEVQKGIWEWAKR
jgi:hypothetical protein